ncbi:MAG: TrkA family potassium uptake protein [Phycisphaerae bacterium]|nr:TrkA family potassium uptake protein [Phycisphaerae bacterium]
MDKFAVIGLGRFGKQLARALTQTGAEVIAIDKDKRIIEQISNEVTVAVRMDSTDEDALRAQGIDKIDVAIVGIGLNFEANLLTTVVLKSIGVKHVCSRAERQLHGKILRRVGADEIIFPKDESAQRWSFKLRAPQISEKLDFAPGFCLAQYSAPESFNGKSIMDLNLRRKFQVNLIGLRRAEDVELAQNFVNVPMPETLIRTGDLLWLIGSDDSLAKLPNK